MKHFRDHNLTLCLEHSLKFLSKYIAEAMELAAQMMRSLEAPNSLSTQAEREAIHELKVPLVMLFSLWLSISPRNEPVNHM